MADKKQKQENKQIEVDFANGSIRDEYKKAVINHVTDKSKTFNTISNAESFIGWMGGKSRTAKDISALCSQITHKIYVEVFAGSAAVFFRKPLASEGSVLNDINGNLINLYEQIRTNIDELIYFLFNTLKSKEQYDKWLKEYGSWKWQELDPLYRAGVYYYLMKYTFSGDESSLHYAHNFKAMSYDTFGQFIKCSEKLQGVSILNTHFRNVINKFNKKESVLFFLDPPYWVANTGVYYKHTFREKDHIELKQLCDSIHKNNNYFLITYDNVKEIRSLYEKYTIFEVEYTYSAQLGNSMKKTEIVITNSTLSKQMDLFI